MGQFPATDDTTTAPSRGPGRASRGGAVRRGGGGWRRDVVAIGGCLALLGGCAGTSQTPHPPARAQGVPSVPTAELEPLSRSDALWLERTSFGLDRALVIDFQARASTGHGAGRSARERFLEAQLTATQPPLPDSIGAHVAHLESAQRPPAEALAAVRAARVALRARADPEAQQAARRALNADGNRLAAAAIEAQLLRAIYSPAQLQEQMVWFWLNHFSLYQHKAEVRWLLGDYERTIRAHALGHFRELVLATLEHPAMLQYLDNAQNAAGHVNENYARELMELHTLGVGAGYTQHDVEALAHVLTGVGVAGPTPPHLKPEWQREYRREGAFEFNPARHDPTPQVLLGERLQGSGFDEIERAVTLLTRQSACARFISVKLATYFVADEPPPALIERMSQSFLRTDGDIRAVLRTLFLAPELDDVLGRKFKDPMRFVISSVRFAYDGRPISNARPLLNWLSGLGEAPFGRATPDGYPSSEASWASAGQMAKRFEIARLIGSGSARLFEGEDGEPAAPHGAFPQLSNRLYFAALEPYLAPTTRSTLEAASSPQEWATLLLAAPEFNYE